MKLQFFKEKSRSFQITIGPVMLKVSPCGNIWEKKGKKITMLHSMNKI
jgi:hypothetical protein